MFQTDVLARKVHPPDPKSNELLLLTYDSLPRRDHIQAIRFACDVGRVVVVEQNRDHGEICFNPYHDLSKKHLDVRGCWRTNFSHFYRGGQMVLDEYRSAPWAKLKTRLSRYGCRQCEPGLSRHGDGSGSEDTPILQINRKTV